MTFPPTFVVSHQGETLEINGFPTSLIMSVRTAILLEPKSLTLTPLVTPPQHLKARSEMRVSQDVGSEMWSGGRPVV